MRGADSDSERIAAGALDKFLNVLGTGVGRILCRDLDLVLNAGESAKLCFDDNAVIVSVLNDLAGERNVILKGLGGCVDHDGGEAAVYAGFAKLIAVTVVKMECYGKSSLLDRSLNKLHQIGVVCVRARTFGHLEDDRSFVLCGGLCDALHDLHVIDIECTYGVTACVGLAEHFLGCYQWHNQNPPVRKMVILHNFFQNHIYYKPKTCYNQ